MNVCVSRGSNGTSVGFSIFGGGYVIEDLRFTRAHGWGRAEGDSVRVGISDYAQEQMSELTFVELPEVGEPAEAADEVGRAGFSDAAG